MSGVAPSSSVTTGVEAVTGRNSLYSSIRPLQAGFAIALIPLFLAHDPDE